MSEKQENNITEEVIEEEQTCKVCGLEDQPLIKGQTPKKPRKSRKISVKTAAKERKDNWIACCVCENWIHTGCAGLTKKEKSKLGGKAFFKCMICCFKVAKAFIIGGAFDVIECNNKEGEESKNPETSCSKNLEPTTNIALHTDGKETSDDITYESVIAFIDNCLAKENSQKESKVEIVEFSGERKVQPRKTEKIVKDEKRTLKEPSEKGS